MKIGGPGDKRYPRWSKKSRTNRRKCRTYN